MGIWAPLSCKESLISSPSLIAGGEEWSSASTRGAAEGGGQSDLAGRDSQVNFRIPEFFEFLGRKGFSGTSECHSH